MEIEILLVQPNLNYFILNSDSRSNYTAVIFCRKNLQRHVRCGVVYMSLRH
jgi:hypothetical protein